MSKSKQQPALKDCPFCGSKPYYTRSVNGSQMHYVGCSTCGIDFKAQEIHYPDRTELTRDIVTAWNSRANLQWLPIESAPKDGTSILLIIPNGLWEGAPPVYIGAYSPSSNEWYTYGASSSGTCWKEKQPTHWMPLPAPPLPIGAQGSEG